MVLVTPSRNDMRLWKAVHGLCTGHGQRALSRVYSNLPESTVYSGPQDQERIKRITLRTIRQKFLKGEPLSMVTAYDYPSAVHVDSAGIDLLLVGDSAGMVVHGHDTTLPVTVSDMMLHCQAVSRGSRRAFRIADLPFGSYESSPQQAIETAISFMKLGNMDAVKLEGGGPERAAAAKAIVGAGVAVMGHAGLMPQSVSVLGGFGPQGKSADAALLVIQDAIAGCFAIVLECIPPEIAAAITAAVDIPTIGIGAGPHCSGQVLVYHDLLGMMQHPHHAKVTPRFCKQYAQIGLQIEEGLRSYNEEVKSKQFPSAQFCPYKIPDEEVRKLGEMLSVDGLHSAAKGLQEFRISKYEGTEDAGS